MIPTFVINLEKRIDRKDHVIQEFKTKSLFDLKLIPAIEDKNGTVGLWKTITQIVTFAKCAHWDYILICEDDHAFTPHFKEEHLMYAIDYSLTNHVDILLGGVSWFDFSVQVRPDLFWLNSFNGLQFTIIFRSFFDRLIGASLKTGEVTDFKISHLSNRKLVLYPFISHQKEFGYSDATIKNDEPGLVTSFFVDTSERLEKLDKVGAFYGVKLW